HPRGQARRDGLRLGAVPEIRRGRMGAVRLVGQTIAFCGLSCLAEAWMLDRFEKPPRGVGSEPGDRQDWQRISGKMRRKSMPVLSVPAALVGGDEVTMAVFHELSRAEGPSQQVRKTTAGSGLRTRGQTGLAANFRQNAPEIHASLVSPGGARGWR